MPLSSTPIHLPFFDHSPECLLKFLNKHKRENSSFLHLLPIFFSQTPLQPVELLANHIVPRFTPSTTFYLDEKLYLEWRTCFSKLFKVPRNRNFVSLRGPQHSKINPCSRLLTLVGLPISKYIPIPHKTYDNQTNKVIWKFPSRKDPATVEFQQSSILIDWFNSSKKNPQNISNIDLLEKHPHSQYPISFTLRTNQTWACTAPPIPDIPDHSFAVAAEEIDALTIARNNTDVSESMQHESLEIYPSNDHHDDFSTSHTQNQPNPPPKKLDFVNPYSESQEKDVQNLETSLSNTIDNLFQSALEHKVNRDDDVLSLIALLSDQDDDSDQDDPEETIIDVLGPQAQVYVEAKTQSALYDDSSDDDSSSEDTSSEDDISTTTTPERVEPVKPVDVSQTEDQAIDTDIIPLEIFQEIQNQPSAKDLIEQHKQRRENPTLENKYAIFQNFSPEAVNQEFHNSVISPALEYPFELDTFQKQAIINIEANENVFVSAHTSAGKTVVAEYAIATCQKTLSRCIYTSPIKALSNQKFREFSKKFGDVGIITGDISYNEDAPCLIMTTEILRSMLYRANDMIRDVKWVIFDEVHYLNDPQRGVVWEEVMIMLPPRVKCVLLSATVSNTSHFAEWVGHIRRSPVYIVSTLYRPVPLRYYLYVPTRMGHIGATSNDPQYQFDKELYYFGNSSGVVSQAGYHQARKAATLNKNEKSRILNPKDTLSKNQKSKKNQQLIIIDKEYGGTVHPYRAENAFLETNQIKVGVSPEQLQNQEENERKQKKQKNNSQSFKKFTARPGGASSPFNSSTWRMIVEMCNRRDLLPVVVFSFSRAKCEECAKMLSGFDLLNTQEKAQVHRLVNTALSRLSIIDQQLPQIKLVTMYLKLGIGIHHSGILPIIKEIVEMCFSDGLCKVLFATDSFAMGVNTPARTVFFNGIRKFDGQIRRYLTTSEFRQAAGRAGRRGIDTVGTVIIGVFENLIPDFKDLNSMVQGHAEPLVSKFRLTYYMLLNLLRVQEFSVTEMLKSSFSEFDSIAHLPSPQVIEKSEKALGILQKKYKSHCDGIESYYYLETQRRNHLATLRHDTLIDSYTEKRLLTTGFGFYLRQGLLIPNFHRTTHEKSSCFGVLFSFDSVSNNSSTPFLVDQCHRFSAERAVSLDPNVGKTLYQFIVANSIRHTTLSYSDNQQQQQQPNQLLFAQEESGRSEKWSTPVWAFCFLKKTNQYGILRIQKRHIQLIGYSQNEDEVFSASHLKSLSKLVQSTSILYKEQQIATVDVETVGKHTLVDSLNEFVQQLDVGQDNSGLDSDDVEDDDGMDGMDRMENADDIYDTNISDDPNTIHSSNESNQSSSKTQPKKKPLDITQDVIPSSQVLAPPEAPIDLTNLPELTLQQKLSEIWKNSGTTPLDVCAWTEISKSMFYNWFTGEKPLDEEETKYVESNVEDWIEYQSTSSVKMPELYPSAMISHNIIAGTAKKDPFRINACAQQWIVLFQHWTKIFPNMVERQPILFNRKSPSTQILSSYIGYQNVCQQIQNHPCHSCAEKPNQMAIMYDYQTLLDNFEYIKYQQSAESLRLSPEFTARLAVLKKLGYIDDSNVVGVKGRVACELSTCEGLIATEIVFQNIFENMTPPEAIALLSALVYQGRNEKPDLEGLPQILIDSIEKVSEIDEKLSQIEQFCDLYVTNRFIAKTQLNFNLVRAVYLWAKGSSFLDITKITTIQEGIIVRTLTRLHELCRQLIAASRCIGNSKLFQKFEDASLLIARDIVFSLSLYI